MVKRLTVHRLERMISKLLTYAPHAELKRGLESIESIKMDRYTEESIIALHGIVSHAISTQENISKAAGADLCSKPKMVALRGVDPDRGTRLALEASEANCVEDLYAIGVKLGFHEVPLPFYEQLKIVPGFVAGVD